MHTCFGDSGGFFYESILILDQTMFLWCQIIKKSTKITRLLKKYTCIPSPEKKPHTQKTYKRTQESLRSENVKRFILCYQSNLHGI